MPVIFARKSAYSCWLFIEEMSTDSDSLRTASRAVAISLQASAVDWVDPQAAMPSGSMRIRAVAARRCFMKSPGCVDGVQRHANACKKYVGSRV